MSRLGKPREVQKRRGLRLTTGSGIDASTSDTTPSPSASTSFIVVALSRCAASSTRPAAISTRRAASGTPRRPYSSAAARTDADRIGACSRSQTETGLGISHQPDSRRVRGIPDETIHSKKPSRPPIRAHRPADRSGRCASWMTAARSRPAIGSRIA